VFTRTQFQRWLSDPEKLVYNDRLAKAWSTLKQRRDELDTDRNKLTAFILGDPQSNYSNAQKGFCFVLCLYLYNRWKSDAAFNFVEMSRRIAALPEPEEGSESALDKPQSDLTLLDTLFEPAIRETLQDISSSMSEGVVDSDTKAEFAKWLSHFVKYDKRGEFLTDVEEWKRVNFPRMSLK